ncbi:NAD(P)H-dependent oxidoreductase subunit E [Shewanella sp. NIFS-20-20]|uniref:NAD(P)H-dependent oxidoreductase subunit E n=1 Tax=Shewanella sp. NIFS-20-20 TaxID=2853806 RepID=UPI001C464227|nr:NADH-ubiquinone oxidoreductase-F iron-sulfur binding region domain-containing protein [Shewanella sp. NIFS-20-20]MBV7315100.1 NAD(P)H-dependent oxidoreductase subunit E [Shewanella sp. NIFS-20-20]
MTTSKSMGVWRSFKGKGRHFPKGRVLDEQAYQQVLALIGHLPKRTDLLIEYLHLLQDHFHGIFARHIKALAEYLGLAEVEVFEVASFYAHFDVLRDDEIPAPLTIRVCHSLSCLMAGADSLAESLSAQLDSADAKVVRAPCLGLCDKAPALALGRHHMTGNNVKMVMDAIEQQAFVPVLPAYQTLSEYLAGGGYQVFKRLEAGSLDPLVLEAELLAAGLRGMGGAGFPANRKWQAVREQPGPRYVAVNGDEGEPGTFKDRHYLETAPHVILEGMLIAALAVNAEKIYIYIRDEYPVALALLSIEIAALIEAGVIAQDWVEIRRGAGAYICGEESAMIESIEGKRGIPRHRPPYVAQQGIFGQPTLVHNIETLYWITRISREGAAIMSAVKKNERSGLRTYSVSGRIRTPGVYLLPAGSSIDDIIAAAGGMSPGHSLYAFQPGGPSSGLLPASLHHIPLDFDTLQAFGSLIGSGAVVVLSQQDKARDAALTMLKFFDHENCGQCTPCRVGCEKAVALMQQATWDKALLLELANVMSDASICGLGQAAANPFKLVIKYFDDEV